MKKAIYKIIKFILILILLSASSVLFCLLSRWTNGWFNVVMIALLAIYITITLKTSKTAPSPDPSDPRSITITPDRKIGDYCYMMGPRGIIRVHICEIKISYSTWQKDNEAYRNVFHHFQHKEHFNCDITYTVEYNGDYKNGVFPDRLYNTESDLIQHLLNNTFIR